MGRRVLRRYIWGCSVCICPIKRTPGLYGLILDQQIRYSVETSLYQLYNSDLKSSRYIIYIDFSDPSF